jgi:molybdopterin converting factor small subunit
MPLFKAKLYTALKGEVLKDEVQMEAWSLSLFLDKLAAHYGPLFREEVYDNGVVKNYHIVILNGKVVDRESLSGVSLESVNSVHIFPAVSGG